MKVLIFLRFLVITAAIIAAGLVASGPKHQALGQKQQPDAVHQMPATMASTAGVNP